MALFLGPIRVVGLPPGAVLRGTFQEPLGVASPWELCRVALFPWAGPGGLAMGCSAASQFLEPFGVTLPWELCRVALLQGAASRCSL